MPAVWVTRDTGLHSRTTRTCLRAGTSPRQGLAASPDNPDLTAGLDLLDNSLIATPTDPEWLVDPPLLTARARPSRATRTQPVERYREEP